MKYYLLLILHLSFSAFIFCQETRVIITIENNSGNSDSVIIGKSYDATTGIDVAFDEQNIYNTTFSGPEIRSIHRTQTYHECLNSSLHDNSGAPLFFDDNRDLKIDYRHGDPFSSINNCFELNFVASDYPLKLKINTTILPGPTHAFWFGLYDSTCNFFQGSYLHEILSEYDITDSSITKIILKKDHEVSVENGQVKQYKIFMRDNFIRISNSNKKIHSLFLYDSKGRLIIQRDNIQIHEAEINISNYTEGLYFLVISNKNGEVLQSEKILKVK